MPKANFFFLMYCFSFFTKIKPSLFKDIEKEKEEFSEKLQIDYLSLFEDILAAEKNNGVSKNIFFDTNSIGYLNRIQKLTQSPQKKIARKKNLPHDTSKDFLKKISNLLTKNRSLRSSPNYLNYTASAMQSLELSKKIKISLLTNEPILKYTTFVIMGFALQKILFLCGLELIDVHHIKKTKQSRAVIPILFFKKIPNQKKYKKLASYIIPLFDEALKKDSDKNFICPKNNTSFKTNGITLSSILNIFQKEKSKPWWKKLILKTLLADTENWQQAISL